ncbi:Protein disulfide-isomerase [Acrodontium crateriforme]|uniref:Protein disulfide-isomerase n=1 Tax=Acrodontium crateriforme TaxID=150365 RepID=A0AAQ3M9B6_9PEZI|nr:Protein disulfide-isomerase [Acrodontium crateriforme]
MKYSFGLLGLAAVACADNVVQLTSDSFATEINKHELSMVEFVTPWCQYCKELAPVFEEAAGELEPKGIPFFKIDCDDEKELCDNQKIGIFPTIKSFRGTQVREVYNGRRTVDEIVTYMTRSNRQNVTSLYTMEEFNEFKSADKISLVGFFEAEDAMSRSHFEAVAEELRSTYSFGSAADVALAKTEGVEQPSIILYKNFDSGKEIYTGDIKEDEVKAFIKSGVRPILGELGPGAEFTWEGLPLGFIFAETKAEREKLTKIFYSFAKSVKDKIGLLTVDPAVYENLAATLDLKADSFPAFAIRGADTTSRYPFELQGKISELTEKAVGAFINKFLDGEAKRVPRAPTAVTVVTNDNFKEEVIDNKKDVLVEFYAPWCGYCKKLEPAYETLAMMFRDESDKVSIVKVDATENDSPEQVKSYPTIMLYPADGKSKPVVYAGDRSIVDLASFIRDNGTHGVKNEKVEDAIEQNKKEAAEKSNKHEEL